MNILNKIYIPVLATAMLASCSDSNNEPGGNVNDGSVAVTIRTEVYTRANVTLGLNDGSTMTVFSKTQGSAQAPDFQKPSRAEMTAGEWKLSPEVRLKEGQTVCLFAVSPYSASYTDPAKIPVNTADQTDLLYSGDFVPASFQTNNVKLRMNHALALMTFNIAYQGQGNPGNLTSISVSGSNVFSTGEMNAETGVITPAKGGAQVTVDVNKPVSATGWTTDLPGQWVIPFDNQSGLATLTANIDGKTYVVPVPSMNIRSGFRYVFHLILTPNGLVFNPAETEEISLNVFNDEIKPSEGYGVVKFGFTGSSFSVPVFSGNSVFGNILSGTLKQNYRGSEEIAIPGSGARDITVETWNSNGFAVSSLEGIESIDISGY